MAERKEQKRGLGRGLSALMADVDPQAQTGSEQSLRPDRTLAVDRIVPNPDQPRRSFTQDQLDELASSIRAKGVIQPLIVRARAGSSEEFEIVAGERRWRAAQLAQLHEVPVLVREYSDTEVLEVAIIENIQRADLNPIEEAAGYKQLMFKFGHTQEKLADTLGKSRSHVANLMRLLNLPGSVQDMVQTNTISAGHARALVTATDPEAVAHTVVTKGLSVRETEKLARKGVEAARHGGKSKSFPEYNKDADTKALEADLSAAMGLKVVIDHTAGSDAGRVTITYDTLDQLDALCSVLGTYR